MALALEADAAKRVERSYEKLEDLTFSLFLIYGTEPHLQIRF